MTGRRAGTSAVLFTVLVVGMMLVLVMFAARTGPQRIVNGTLVDPSFKPVIPSFSVNPLGFGQHHKGNGVIHHHQVFTWIGWAIKIAFYVLVAWLVYRGARRAREVVRERKRPEPRPTDVDFDVLEDPDELVDEMQSDAQDQLALLLGGAPRNAIVACWDRFEEQAERVGLARRPWETSSEFTLRLLDFVSADGGAVARLERLYHEARFSDHVIDEDRRSQAIEALEAIHASLPARRGGAVTAR
jgi:hypothetical protein